MYALSISSAKSDPEGGAAPGVSKFWTSAVALIFMETPFTPVMASSLARGLEAGIGEYTATGSGIGRKLSTIRPWRSDHRIVDLVES